MRYDVTFNWFSSNSTSFSVLKNVIVGCLIFRSVRKPPSKCLFTEMPSRTKCTPQKWAFKPRNNEETKRSWQVVALQLHQPTFISFTQQLCSPLSSILLDPSPRSAAEVQNQWIIILFTRLSAEKKLSFYQNLSGWTMNHEFLKTPQKRNVYKRWKLFCKSACWKITKNST